jgi:hypothetical protein
VVVDPFDIGECEPSSRQQRVVGGRPIMDMAGRQVAVRGGAERRLLAAAAIERIETAGGEAAAVRRIDRTRHVALEDDALARVVGSGTGTAERNALL